MENYIPVIIPAYEPDERLLSLLKSLKEEQIDDIIVVNDGSADRYDRIFSEAEEIIRPHGRILSYPRNRGKGYALKTAFQYVLQNGENLCGLVTADSDGQHTAGCIRKIITGIRNNPDSLILGVRDFSGKDIPVKSSLGNKITKKVFQSATGFCVTDTQTGLRGIPKELAKECLLIKENRFDFEMQMLIGSIGRYPIVEIPIRTVYDSKTNHQTHFDTVKDSFRIYRHLVRRFVRYCFASISSCIVDMLLFAVFCALLKGSFAGYAAVSTVIARVVSASFNFVLNYGFVFRSKEKTGRTAVKYFTLATVQMGMSALFVTAGIRLLPLCPEVVIKAVVDACLFVISYGIQKKSVF